MEPMTDVARHPHACEPVDRDNRARMVQGERKHAPGRFAKLVRLVGSMFDPRAWIHMARMANYYNYTHVVPRRSVRFGRNPAISPDVSFANPERIVIGNDVRIGARCQLWAGPSTGKITIADDVLIGPDVMITAATYRFNDGSPVTSQRMDEGDVRIGRDVWLGAKVVVMPGVSIGDGAVVGASAVVTRDIPAGSVAVGAPANVVGQREE